MLILTFKLIIKKTTVDISYIDWLIIHNIKDFGLNHNILENFLILKVGAKNKVADY